MKQAKPDPRDPRKNRLRHGVKKSTDEEARAFRKGTESNLGLGWCQGGADPVAEELGRAVDRLGSGDPQELDFEEDE